MSLVQPHMGGDAASRLFPDNTRPADVSVQDPSSGCGQHVFCFFLLFLLSLLFSSLSSYSRLIVAASRNMTRIQDPLPLTGFYGAVTGAGQPTSFALTGSDDVWIKEREREKLSYARNYMNFQWDTITRSLTLPRSSRGSGQREASSPTPRSVRG